MRVKKYLLATSFLFGLSLFFSCFFGASVFAQTQTIEERTFEGRVNRILEEKYIRPTGAKESQLYQKLEILLSQGAKKNKKIVVENGNLPLSNLQRYELGDELVITERQNYAGKTKFYITDYVRRKALLWLFLIFVIVAVVVGHFQGLASIIGMGISFLVIFKFILPRIAAGSDPVQSAIYGSLLIIPATFLLSHGFNKKTGVAIIGTLVSLVFTGLLAHIFVEAARLTGFASEEAGFLQVFKPGLINIKGLLLAGIIIGVLGVLDDITVSQAAIVEQLKATNSKLSVGELYKKAMAIGKDHIASMVNTLILVYTGATLPLLLIFIDNPHPFSEIINYEIIADEVVRTLVGSIGLMLAVPLTTIIAALLAGINYQSAKARS